jgi:phage gpG-like protein
MRSAPEGIFDLSPTSNGVQLEYGSKVPYAAAHEYGMNERVNVHTHARQQTHFFGEELDSPITVRVHAHSRMMNIPERPYLGPALEDTEGEIVDIIEEEVTQELLN